MQSTFFKGMIINGATDGVKHFYTSWASEVQARGLHLPPSVAATKEPPIANEESKKLSCEVEKLLIETRVHQPQTQQKSACGGTVPASPQAKILSSRKPRVKPSAFLRIYRDSSVFIKTHWPFLMVGVLLYILYCYMLQISNTYYRLDNLSQILHSNLNHTQF